MKAEIKTEPLTELKHDTDSKEEKMDVKTESDCKPELNSVKDDNDTSSPKLEGMDDNSQTGSNEEKALLVADTSSVLSTTTKPRCKKGKTDLHVCEHVMFILAILYFFEPTWQWLVQVHVSHQNHILLLDR